jgi:hypothetical protein
MVIAKKKEKKQIAQDEIDRIINMGGKTVEESKTDLNEMHKFLMRIPTDILLKIDTERKKRTGWVSRNQFILEILERYCNDIAVI